METEMSLDEIIEGMKGDLQCYLDCGDYVNPMWMEEAIKSLEAMRDDKKKVAAYLYEDRIHDKYNP